MTAPTRLRYAYNTNGLAHHRLDDALSLLADTGYHGVALTLDVHHLDPFAPDAFAQAHRLRERCDTLGLDVVVETGARYLLDPRVKHEPTLVTAEPQGRARRLAYLRLACDLAEVLGAEAVSFWAGVPHADIDWTLAWSWLVDGVRALVDSHGQHSYVLAVEPEPGMLVEDCEDWFRLHEQVPGITLPLDEGDVDLTAVLAALVDVAYAGLVTLELSRDSHRAHEMVPRALHTLLALDG